MRTLLLASAWLGLLLGGGCTAPGASRAGDQGTAGGADEGGSGGGADCWDGNGCVGDNRGLHGPWFYNGCSNVSPWCTGHSDCQGYPVRMQWRNQSDYQTATAHRCSNHGEIYVR